MAEVKASLDAKDTELEDLRAKVNNNRKLSKEEEHSIQGKYHIIDVIYVNQGTQWDIFYFYSINTAAAVTFMLYMIICFLFVDFWFSLFIIRGSALYCTKVQYSL